MLSRLSAIGLGNKSSSPSSSSKHSSPKSGVLANARKRISQTIGIKGARKGSAGSEQSELSMDDMYSGGADNEFSEAVPMGNSGGFQVEFGQAYDKARTSALEEIMEEETKQEKKYKRNSEEHLDDADFYRGSPDDIMKRTSALRK